MSSNTGKQGNSRDERARYFVEELRTKIDVVLDLSVVAKLVVKKL